MSMTAEDEYDLKSRQLAVLLHDEIGQSLTGLSLCLQVIKNQLGPETSPVVHEHMNDALALLEQITRQVRVMVVNLDPGLPDVKGSLKVKAQQKLGGEE